MYPTKGTWWIARHDTFWVLMGALQRHVFYALTNSGKYAEFNPYNRHVFPPSRGYKYWKDSDKSCLLEVVLLNPDIPYENVVNGREYSP